MDGGQSIDAVAAPRASSRTASDAVRSDRALPLLGSVAVGLVLPLTLLGLWQLSAQYDVLPEQLLPPPRAVFDALRDGIDDGSLLANMLVSLRRVAEGFVAGGVLGLMMGAAVGLSDTLRRMLEPSFLALGQVPVFAWVPILVLVAGLDDLPKLLIIAWSAFVPVLLNTAQGIRDVPPSFLELGRVLSFSRWTQLVTIVVPAAIPPVFTGLREGLANSWQALVAVELLGSFEGLGYMMAYGRQLFQLELVLAAAIVVGVIGLALHLTLGGIERHLQRWRTDAGP